MTDNNKPNRIVKDSVLLYIRMAITMLIGINANRFIIVALCIGDYVIYNVVDGVTTMFVFPNSAMAVSTSHFLTFEIVNDNKNLDLVYNQTRTIHYTLVFLICFLIEVVSVCKFRS